MLETEKQIWLAANGYKPIDEKIIRENLVQIYIQSPSAAARLEEEHRGKFKYYKRYGKFVMPYSTGYLEKHSIEELKKRDRRNVWRYVISEAWPIKRIIRMWYRFSFRYL